MGDVGHGNWRTSWPSLCRSLRPPERGYLDDKQMKASQNYRRAIICSSTGSALKLWNWTRSWVGDDQRIPCVVLFLVLSFFLFWSVSSIPLVPQPCIPRKRRGRTSSERFVPGSMAYISENGTVLDGKRLDKSPLSDSHFACPYFALGGLETQGDATGRLCQGKSMCWLKPTREASPRRGF